MAHVAAATAFAADVKSNSAHETPGKPGFKLQNIPPPARNDAATKARFTLIDGVIDPNSAGLAALNDGRLPTTDDQPDRNFFFNANTQGGRLLLDLGKTIAIKEIRTYSWHRDVRAAQVYTLYASDSVAAAGSSRKRASDPEKSGWTKIQRVTNSHLNDPLGGQLGVVISGQNGAIGNYRFLLFDIEPTKQNDPFAQTFYSEIDVIDQDAPTLAETDSEPEPKESKQVVDFEANGQKYKFTFDTTIAPDLAPWVAEKLVPVVKEWYPKLVAMLPSEGYTSATNVTVRFRNDMGGTPASAGGNFINCNATWFAKELNREALGAVVHEMVHTVQNYGLARRNNPNATRTPGWIVEGIPDYIRWFLYEPQTKGAEITSRNLARAKYDASYRITGNFIDWVVRTYDKDIVPKLNAEARAGRYKEELWKDYTGKTLQELGDEWKKQHEDRLAKVASLNKTSDDPKTAAWRPLFNGTNLAGWHNFKSDKIQPGWQVRDGILVCEDPHHAGDLVTDDEFAWFELELEYNIASGGNSGIMYRVSKEGPAAWASGPEVQLEDNAKAADPQRCGWLYALYQPPIDPKTNKPLDATKPAGEWNKVRILISPDKCEHWINDVKYFDYVLGSEDFNARVAKSKFATMPHFAKAPKGAIALQGDHGQVSFRNIRIRELQK